MFLLGFDVGGTKIEAALFQCVDQGEGIPFQDSSGRVLRLVERARQRVPTERHLGYKNIVDKMGSLGRTLCAEARILPTDLTGVGLGMPGSINPHTRRMTNGNTMVLIDKPLVDDLRERLATPVTIHCENDANCFALAEVMCGAGMTHAEKFSKPTREQIAVGIILGTGCGGGIMINGRVVQGSRGGGGEIGHTILHENGIMCYCGRKGCAEQYLSGTGLEAHFNGRRYAQVPEFISARQIFESARNHDPLAVACVKQYQLDLGAFLGNLTSLLDPDYFVLGGGVSLQPALYEGLSNLIAQHTFLPNSQVPVYQNRLGDSAGVIGAALLPL